MDIKYRECGRCGRKLTNTASQRRGFGRHCHRVNKAKAARLLAAYKPEQVAKALVLVRDVSFQPCAPGVYEALSSNKRDVYVTSEGSCDCPAGKRGVGCYHRLAVALKGMTRA